MKQDLIKIYAMTHANAHKLVADVPCERFAEMPYEQAKHPGWVLGHLCAAGYFASQFLGADAGEPGSWLTNCPPGQPVKPDRSLYEPKATLLASFDKIHETVHAAMLGASDELLASPLPEPSMRAYFPTVSFAMMYMLGHHEGFHLGQLSQWRVLAGFPAAKLT